MKSKKIFFALSYAILIWFLFILTTVEKTSGFSSENLIAINDIVELRINDKILSKDLIPYLDSINHQKKISIGRDYFSQFDLQENTSDKIKITYNDGSSKLLFAGLQSSGNSKVYIRMANEDIIYEISGDIFKILKENPVIDKESNLFDSLSVTSIIALKFSSPNLDMYITESNDKIWIDQLSGLTLDRLKIQNLINKITKLRVMKDEDNTGVFEPTHIIRLETLDSREFNIMFALTDDETIHLSDNNFFYNINRSKLDFLNSKLKDLQ